MMEKILLSAKETQSYSRLLGQKSESGMVYALIGDLGTGKTTFSQGFAQGLGINVQVGSPTFKLVSEYSGIKLKLNHVDCYRLKNSVDFINIGGENLLYPENGVTLIEWADIIEDILPSHSIRVEFSRIKGHNNQRKLIINGLSS